MSGKIALLPKRIQTEVIKFLPVESPIDIAASKDAIFRHIELFSKLTGRPQNLSLLASWVNHHNIPLRYLELNKEGLKALASFLRRMNLSDYPFEREGWSSEEIFSLIKTASSRLTSLDISISQSKLSETAQSKLIEELPEMPHLERLQCSRSGIKKILSYPSLKFIGASYCYQLEEIEDQKQLELLRCCASLIQRLPKAPKLHYLDIDNCNHVIEVPSFTLLNTLSCQVCLNLIKIHPSFSLQTLRCRGCKKLNTLPSGLNLLEDLQYFGCPIKELPFYPMLQNSKKGEIAETKEMSES